MPQFIKNVFSDDFSHLPKNKTPFDDPISKRALINRITQLPDLQNCRILYIGKGPAVIIRDFPNGGHFKPVTVAISPATSNQQVNAEINPLHSEGHKDEHFYTELVNVGINCSVAAISVFLAVGGTAALPISGGGSVIVVNLATASGWAAGIQCANSGYRLFNETDAGDENKLIWLDSQAWYTSVNVALDVVSLAGAVSTFGSTLKMVLNLKKAGTSIPNVLKGLDSKSRKKLTKELILAQNPGMSGKRVKALMRAQKIPKGYAAIDISFTARNQLIDALAASLSVAGSAYSGIVKNTPKFIISVVEEIESY